MTLSLLGYALSALMRRKGKALAIFGGLATMVAFVSVVMFAGDAMTEEALRAKDALPDLVVQRLSGGRPRAMPSRWPPELSTIPSVKNVVGRVWGYVFLPEMDANVTVVGVPSGSDALARLSVQGGMLSEGSVFTPGHHEMIAGETLARALGLHLHDALALRPAIAGAPTLSLSGTFASSVDLYTSDLVLCDEADARLLLGYGEDEVTDLAVTVSNPAEASVVAHTISLMLPDARVVERDLLGRVYHLVYGRRSGVLVALAIPALLAFLVIAWDRLVGVSVEERREIAVLKATGWSTSDVLLAKGAESAILAISASALGMALSYVWVFVFGAVGLRAALGGFSVLGPVTHLTPSLDVGLLLGLLLSVAGPFVALSVVPAWRAATIDPMEAMKG